MGKRGWGRLNGDEDPWWIMDVLASDDVGNM